jgi:hypothetical protein
MNNIQIIVIIIVLVILIIGALVLNSQHYVPANEVNTFTRNYPYKAEGFEDKKNEYSSYSNNSALDSYSRWEINADKKSCYKVNGVSGLVCSPNDEVTNPKDIYSEAKGSLDCQSYGLTNSKGFLCLNEQQKTLYTTRGGNASGGAGDIGLFSK